jgi:hypothetical protein
MTVRSGFKFRRRQIDLAPSSVFTSARWQIFRATSRRPRIGCAPALANAWPLSSLTAPTLSPIRRNVGDSLAGFAVNDDRAPAAGCRFIGDGGAGGRRIKEMAHERHPSAPLLEF